MHFVEKEEKGWAQCTEVSLYMQEEVKYLFSLPGVHLFPIYDACLDAGVKITGNCPRAGNAIRQE